MADCTFKACVPTQCQSAEVDGLAVRAVAALVSGPYLEGIDGAGDQGGHRHCVSLTEHAHSRVLV